MILGAVLTMTVLTGCKVAQEDNKQVPEIQNAVTEMEKTSMDEELVVKISEMLGCGSRTSESILKILSQYADGTITDITKETDQIGVRLLYTDEAGNDYLALVGEGFFVEEIYRDGEDGERLFRAIE